ncbi:MAG TPA: ferric reductase-like transmembrane domain-containing protein [Trebonia sp.]|nr:ferric reductase-like transmembrane domain-containing protein [Trebonia sp.]
MSAGPAAAVIRGRRAMAIPPRVVLGLIAAGAAAAVYLWWASTPDVNGLGGWLTGAGQICGLECGYSVVVLVALMARIPPVERGAGADRLARWHAMGGRYVISLVSAHALLIIWGYAVEARQNVVAETGTLLTGYPDVLMATVAWFLLLATAFVSARKVRSKLRYETWYYLHLYTYLAIALAFSHQFADGSAFTTDLAARFWWSALYAVVGAAVLWYRVVIPARDYVRHDFRVAGVREEAPRTVSIYVRGRRLRELEAEPGQFFRWRFLTRGLWWQSHPYSLSAAPSDDLLRITLRDAEGKFAALKPGTRLIAAGPFGAFMSAGSGHPVLLLAGGVGVAPLRAMFATLPGPVTLVYRASSDDDVVFRPELDSIAAAKGATVHYLVGGRDAFPADPLSAPALRELVPGVEQMDVYLCGPPGMTAAAAAALHDIGVPRRRVHFESFEF